MAFNMFDAISSQERVDFAKSLAVMLKSGITINEALAALADQAKSKAFRKILLNIKNEVEMGTSLSEAFKKEEKIFGKIFISLIRAGETSGTLDENLFFLAQWLERSNDLNNEISTATLYPKIIFSATFFMGGSLAVFILPKLLPLFKQLKVELPLATRMLLYFSLFVQKFWAETLLAIFGLIIFFNLINRVRAVKSFFHLIYIRLPLFGNLMRDYQLALFCQVLFTLLKSGLPISESLDITAEAVTNVRYRETVEKIKKRVISGVHLSEAMKDYRNFYPPNLINIIAVGERSGNLENSFLYLAEFYSKEVAHKTKKLPTIIEPVLLIFIGLSVGFVALSIIMPIYQLTQGIR